MKLLHLSFDRELYFKFSERKIRIILIIIWRKILNYHSDSHYEVKIIRDMNLKVKYLFSNKLFFNEGKSLMYFS